MEEGSVSQSVMFYSDKNKGSQHKDAKMSVLQQHIHFLIHSVQADWINEVMPKYVIDSHITASLDNAFILKFATGSLCVHHSGLDSWRQLLEADLSLHIQLCGYRTDITASGFLLFTLLFWFHFFPPPHSWIKSNIHFLCEDEKV